jgi:two-component system, NtrC family, response regulator GlrR
VRKHRRHILVVDDEPHVLLTYELILQQQGYDVSAAVSAEEARRVLRERKIDLLLCDLSLERRENGIDVIQFARQKDPEMPAVLLTGYATQDANDLADQSSIPVLFKPIDINQLLQTIADMLRNVYEQRKAAG